MAIIQVIHVLLYSFSDQHCRFDGNMCMLHGLRVTGQPMMYYPMIKVHGEEESDGPDEPDKIENQSKISILLQ